MGQDKQKDIYGFRDNNNKVAELIKMKLAYCSTFIFLRVKQIVWSDPYPSKTDNHF